MLEMWNPLRFWFKDFPLYKLWVASLEPWPGPSPILRSVRAPRVLRRSPTSSLPMAWRTRAPEPLRPMLPRPMGDVMWCPTWLVVPYHMLCWFMLVYVGLCWFVPAVLSQPLLVDVYCRLHRWVHVLPHHAIPSHAIPSHESTPRSDMIFVGLALAEPPQKQRRARFQHVVGHHHCAGQQHTQLLHDRKVLVVAGAFPQVKRGETVQSRQQWLIPSP